MSEAGDWEPFFEAIEKKKEKKLFVVIDNDNRIYFNELGAEEGVMTYEEAVKLNDFLSSELRIAELVLVEE